MRWLLGLPLSFVFSFLLISLVLLLPLPFIFTKENTKYTLHEINFYNRIIVIVKTKSVTDFTNQTSFFDKLIKTNIDTIVSRDWVEKLGDSFIDHSFASLSGDTRFSEHTLDLVPLKKNYLDLLSKSDLKPNVREISSSIPDQIKLTDLLQIEAVQLDANFALLKTGVNLFLVTVLALLILLILTAAVFLLIFPGMRVLPWLTINLVFSGLLLFSSTFVFHIFLLKPSFLQEITLGQSLWEILQTIVALSFLEKLVRIWSLLGFAFLVLSLGLGLFQLFKPKNY